MLFTTTLPYVLQVPVVAGAGVLGAGRKKEPAWMGTAGRNTAQAEWTKS